MRKRDLGFALTLVSLMALAILPTSALAQNVPEDSAAAGQYGDACVAEADCPAVADDGGVTNSLPPAGVLDIPGAFAAPVTQGSAELEENLSAEASTSGVALASINEEASAPAMDNSTAEAPIYATGGSNSDSAEITVLPNTGGAPPSALLLGVMLVIGGAFFPLLRRTSETPRR